VIDLSEQRKVKSVSEYLEAITDAKERAKRNNAKTSVEPTLYFRGQRENYGNTRPSIARFLQTTNANSKKFRDTENQIIEDYMAKIPGLFNECENNFDRLALAQHHQLPTRLLDLTTDPLVALYFAVEGNFFSSQDVEDDGFVYPFSDQYNQRELKKSLEADNLDDLIDLFKRTLSKERAILKSPYSDEIVLESSLARLNDDDRACFLKKLRKFFSKLKKSYDLSDRNLKLWSELYEKIIEIRQFNIMHQNLPGSLIKEYRTWKNQDVSEAYNELNDAVSTGRLYHQVREDINDFAAIINPMEMYAPKIVTPRLIDDRIKNQRGCFMFVPFIDMENQNNSEYGRRMQRRINILKISDGDGLLRIVIPGEDKPYIRKQLKDLGITGGFVYPDPKHIAEEIVEQHKERFCEKSQQIDDCDV